MGVDGLDVVLRQNELEWRHITDAIAVNVVVQNPMGTCLFANRTALEYWGLSLDDVTVANYRAPICAMMPRSTTTDCRASVRSRSIGKTVTFVMTKGGGSGCGAGCCAMPLAPQAARMRAADLQYLGGSRMPRFMVAM